MLRTEGSARKRWGQLNSKRVKWGGFRRTTLGWESPSATAPIGIVAVRVTDPSPPVRHNDVLVKAFQALVHALQAKDPYTAGHSLRVSAYSKAIAQEMGLESELIGKIQLGGELHDVGKIGVPERLLHKKGRLSESEYRQVMQHTVIGEGILAPLLADNPTVLQVVRSHHERFDGQGGPDGLTGESIPLAARIVSVADSFDAMTSTRPYREQMTSRAALAELKKNAGLQFDARCVTAMTNLIARVDAAPAGRRASVGCRRPRLVRAARYGAAVRLIPATRTGRGVVRLIKRPAVLDRRVTWQPHTSPSLFHCA